jgi:hypothetical protein
VVNIDSTVADTLLEQLGIFKTDLLTQFNSIIPLALGVIITVTVVYLAIHWFRSLTGLGNR